MNNYINRLIHIQAFNMLRYGLFIPLEDIMQYDTILMYSEAKKWLDGEGYYIFEL